jgi:hypothetical protein
MRDEGMGCSRFKVQGSRFKVSRFQLRYATWNLEL